MAGEVLSISTCRLPFSQLDKSIQTSLETHPNLVKYYVCLPRNLSDGRSPNKETGKQNKTEQNRWNDHKAKWQQWANEKGKSVEFVLWDEQEIYDRLSRESNRGLCRFWFDQELFSSEWFQGRVTRVVNSQEGKRFHPDIDVELDIYNAVRILGRDRKAIASKLDIVTPVQDLCKNLRDNSFFNEMQLAIDELNKIVVTKCTSEALAKTVFSNFQEELEAALNEVNNALEELHKSLQSLKQSDDKYSAKWHQWSEPAGLASYIEEVVLGQFASILSKRVVVIKGDAGQGKTHLLCSLSQELAGKGHPVVLTLGQNLDARKPWDDIKSSSELDFSGSRDEFLGALSASANADNNVALIMIDALNESENRELWRDQLSSILEDIKQYPNIFMVVSVRTSYSTIVLPDAWRQEKEHDEVIFFEHHGFLGLSYEAVKTIFSSNGITMGPIPLLLPEWSNPLFVILVAKMLKRKGEKAVPPGLNGINQIHRCIIDEVNKKLAERQHLDFDSDDNIVHKALFNIAASMLESGDLRISKSEAIKFCDALHRPNGYSSSLLPRLFDENLLVPYRNHEGDTFVYFEFERMAHLWQAESITQNYPNEEAIRVDFAKTRKLGKYIKDSNAVSMNSGLLEALIMKIPTVYNCEFIDLMPVSIQDDPQRFMDLYQLWLKCLKWRSPENIDGEHVLSLIHGRRMRPDCWSSFVDLLISVGPIPDHPLNGDFLHDWLVQKSMPDRDEYWSVELHNHFGSRLSEELEQYAINVQLDWVDYATNPRKGRSAVQLNDEVVDLAGTLFGWLLPSPNRELRDRTTKALVKLYRHKPTRLTRFLGRFLEVNDPYVVERALAAAYGCILTINDAKCIQEIAEYIYRSVFLAEEVPTHLLARDYAVGIVCYARHKGFLSNVDPETYLPPFNATYEKEALTCDELEKLYGEINDSNPLATPRWHSDFYRYILGTNHYNFPWIPVELNQPRHIFKQDIIDEFVSSLTEKQRIAYLKFKEAQSSIRLLNIVMRNGTPEEPRSFSVQFDADSDNRSHQLVNRARNAFLRSLGVKKRELYVDSIESVSDAPNNDEQTFDLEQAQRWIEHRVIKLGWTYKKFERYDSNVDRRYGARNDHRVERIFKKYQWIAYWKLLARVADNFQFVGDDWRSSVKQFKGVWQISYDRDIDPSLLLEKTCANYRHLPVWWAPIDYLPSAQLLTSRESVIEWLRDPAQFPKVEKLLCVTDDEGTEWIALWGTYSVEVKLPQLGNSADVSAYIDMQSYLVRQADVDRVKEVLLETQSKELSGRPYGMSFENAFMGELFWSDAYTDHCESDPNPDWRPVNERDENSIKVLPTTDTYTREGSGYDKSISDSVELPIPCRWLARELGLRWSGHGSEFIDSKGDVVMYSPAVDQPGPNVFLCRKCVLEGLLQKHGFTILHSIWGHKRAYWEGLNYERDGVVDFNYAAVATMMSIEPNSRKYTVK